MKLRCDNIHRMRFWPFPLLALTLAAQTPSFEVAAIRPSESLSTPPPLCSSLRLTTESMLASGVYRLDSLVREAYQNVVDDFDLPQWIRNNGNFAVNVSIPPGTDVDTCRQMLRNLLAERFHLVTDVETREVTRYYLKVSRSGLKLKPVEGPPSDPNASYTFSVQGGVSHYVFRGAPMSRVFRAIESSAGFAPEVRIAGFVDETGLTGYYDGELQVTVARRRGPDQFPQPESIEDAIVRQLGLTLELRKAPGQVLVIRSSDRMPTEN